MKPPSAAGAHGEDKTLSSAGRSSRPGDGQCPQAPDSPGGKEGGSWEPRADGRRARGFGPGQLLHNRAGLQAGASSPYPACLSSSDSLRPHQPTPCFPHQGSCFQERLLLSRWAGCSPPLLPLPWIPFSSGIPSSPPLLPALRPAKSLSPLCGSPCLGLLAFCAASDCS